MELWWEWFKGVGQLRAACNRKRTFTWMVVVLAALSVRADLAGVTSFVRGLALKPSIYRRLLHLFHSSALNVHRLTRLWIQLVQRIFPPLFVDNRRVCVVDGLKIPKEGRKMPAVKKLHQSSQDNSKPAYIMGHSLQAVSLLVQNALGAVMVAQIHEGVIFLEGRKQKLTAMMADMGVEVADCFEEQIIFLADAYYACKEMIRPLLEEGHDLVTRVRFNTVGYFPAPKPQEASARAAQVLREKGQTQKALGRGRPVRDGPQSGLWRGKSGNRLSLPGPFVAATRPFGQVKHPSRGRIMLMTTDLSMDPLAVITIYGYRFKIELGFKQALHVIGT